MSATTLSGLVSTDCSTSWLTALRHEAFVESSVSGAGDESEPAAEGPSMPTPLRLRLASSSLAEAVSAILGVVKEVKL